MNSSDTIAAIATPSGMSGIGIIKLSGPDAVAIIGQIFSSPSFHRSAPRSHSLFHGTIVDPADGCAVDEVLVSFMKRPASHTGEDVVEINCHGGMLALQKVLDLALSHGARPAEPGEFTKRAFMNGRIDLTEAEAVIDIIEARTEASLKLAAQHATGALKHHIGGLRSDMLSVLSCIEAAIDFPEDEPDIMSFPDMADRLMIAREKISSLLSTYSQGKALRCGVQAVIIGAPNAGKSSLLNALLDDERAIVTSVPGTTRDIIEGSISIRGIPFTLYDTAGIHDAPDTIEKIGIERAHAKTAEADIVILVMDASIDCPDDYSTCIPGASRDIIVVLNKSDLPRSLRTEKLHETISPKCCIAVSALYKTGIGDLKSMLADCAAGDSAPDISSLLISNARHNKALQDASVCLEQAHRLLLSEASFELVALDLKEALDSLGEIIGTTTPDDVLDLIFSSFCIGK